jgi:hypothetical protein
MRRDGHPVYDRKMNFEDSSRDSSTDTWSKHLEEFSQFCEEPRVLSPSINTWPWFSDACGPFKAPATTSPRAVWGLESWESIGEFDGISLAILGQKAPWTSWKILRLNHHIFVLRQKTVRLCLPSPKMDQDRQTDSQPDRQTHESWVCCQSLWWWNRWKQIKIRPLLELSSVIFSSADLYHLTIPLFCFTWGLDLTLAQAWNCSDVAIQWVYWVYCCPIQPVLEVSWPTFHPSRQPSHPTCRARLPGFWWSMAPWMTLSSGPFWRSWGFWRTERQEW